MVFRGKVSLSQVLIVVLIWSLLMALVPAYAQEEGAVTVTPAGAGAIVRSGPGTEYTILGTLHEGFWLTATGRNDYPADFACTGVAGYDAQAWLRVELVEYAEGWVNLCVVDVTGDPALLPVAEPAYPLLIDTAEFPELTAEGWEPENPLFASLTLGEVIVHEYPTLGSAILGTIAAGEVVELLAISESGDWVQIRYGETEGWIVGFMVTVSEAQAAALPVINLEEFFAALIADLVGEDGAGCGNPPPPWAMAHGWRRQCQGIPMHTYVPEPPPGHQRQADAEE